jgi:hypothetical protein
MRTRVRRRIATLLLAALMTVTLTAQLPRGVVVDQTGLPLPGTRLELRRGTEVLRDLITGLDGSFELAGHPVNRRP